LNFYIADLHPGHENIMRLSKRPFNTLTQIHNTIVKNWSSRVTANSTVYPFVEWDGFFRGLYHC